MAEPDSWTLEVGGNSALRVSTDSHPQRGQNFGKNRLIYGRSAASAPLSGIKALVVLSTELWYALLVEKQLALAIPSTVQHVQPRRLR